MLVENSSIFRKKIKLSYLEPYLNYGGFPGVSNMLHNGAKDEITNYLSTIYLTILEKDIYNRNKVRSKFDFHNITQFMFDSIGSLVSPYNISKTITNSGNKINKATVDNYLTLLCESFILYPAYRYDIKGKKLLQTLNKFYGVDVGLITSVIGRNANINRGHLLENIVYLELLRRYRVVNIGKNNNMEVNFVVKDDVSNISYFQVSLTVRDSNTLKRELESLLKIKDHYPKYLLTLDPEHISHNGINQLNILKWLLNDIEN